MTNINMPAPLVAWSVGNGLWPHKPQDPQFLPGGIGPRYLPVTLDFSATGSNGSPITGDIVLSGMLHQIGHIQTLFVDNSLNTAASFSIQFEGTNQLLSVPKNSQAYLPVCILPDSTAYVAKTTGLVLVNLGFINMPMPAFLWAAS